MEAEVDINLSTGKPITNFDRVRTFHLTYGQEVKTTPEFPDEKVIELRDKLIAEEFLKEYRDAVKARDIVAVADALTDILYVVYGAGHAFGIDLDACFKEVQRSNMSKLGADGQPVRREDGKVLKGPNFSEPDLKKVLKLHKGVNIGDTVILTQEYKPFGLEAGAFGVVHDINITDGTAHVKFNHRDSTRQCSVQLRHLISSHKLHAVLLNESAMEHEAVAAV